MIPSFSRGWGSRCSRLWRPGDFFLTKRTYPQRHPPITPSYPVDRQKLVQSKRRGIRRFMSSDDFSNGTLRVGMMRRMHEKRSSMTRTLEPMITDVVQLLVKGKDLHQEVCGPPTVCGKATRYVSGFYSQPEDHPMLMRLVVQTLPTIVILLLPLFRRTTTRRRQKERVRQLPSYANLW